jgi:hypothetical protein
LLLCDEKEVEGADEERGDEEEAEREGVDEEEADVEVEEGGIFFFS